MPLAIAAMMAPAHESRVTFRSAFSLQPDMGFISLLQSGKDLVAHGFGGSADGLDWSGLSKHFRVLQKLGKGAYATV